MQPYIQCLFCIHLYEDGNKCKAFPIQIPDDIWDGDHDHRRLYKGDNGILFEPVKKEIKEEIK